MQNKIFIKCLVPECKKTFSIVQEDKATIVECPHCHTKGTVEPMEDWDF